MTHRPLIAVFGSSTVREGDEAYARALALGRALARAGADVLTGGYSGVMEACSRGAHEEGAHVVGVTVDTFERRGPANRWVKERVHTPHLYARLQQLVERAEGFVVAPGSLGTLTELFLTWTLLSIAARPLAPLVLLGAEWHGILDAHRGAAAVPEALFRYVQVTADPVEAARMACGGAVFHPGAS